LARMGGIRVQKCNALAKKKKHGRETGHLLSLGYWVGTNRGEKTDTRGPELNPGYSAFGEHTGKPRKPGKPKNDNGEGMKTRGGQNHRF